MYSRRPRRRNPDDAARAAQPGALVHTSTYGPLLICQDGGPRKRLLLGSIGAHGSASSARERSRLETDGIQHGRTNAEGG